LLLVNGIAVYIAICCVAIGVGILVGELRHYVLGRRRWIAWAQTLMVIVLGVGIGFLVGKV
jgi:F0F1-type ATP synthase membrane subunit c/vacuolar-type H+-ATPase subunit K